MLKPMFMLILNGLTGAISIGVMYTCVNNIISKHLIQDEKIEYLRRKICLLENQLNDLQRINHSQQLKLEEFIYTQYEVID
jgi:hypothetical protein